MLQLEAVAPRSAPEQGEAAETLPGGRTESSHHGHAGSSGRPQEAADQAGTCCACARSCKDGQSKEPAFGRDCHPAEMPAAPGGSRPGQEWPPPSTPRGEQEGDARTLSPLTGLMGTMPGPPRARRRDGGSSGALLPARSVPQGLPGWGRGLLSHTAGWGGHQYSSQKQGPGCPQEQRQHKLGGRGSPGHAGTWLRAGKMLQRPRQEGKEQPAASPASFPARGSRSPCPSPSAHVTCQPSRSGAEQDATD